MKHVLFSVVFALALNVLAQQSLNEPIVLKGHGNDVDGLSVSPLGYIATGGYDNKISVYSADSPYASFKTLTGHMGPVNVVAFSRNGKLLATGSEDRMIILWRNSRKFEAHKDKINCLIFDNYGRYLFSGSDDRNMMVWDLKTGTNVKTIDNGLPVTAIAPTGNFKIVYVADAGPKIKMYDMMSGKVAKTLDGHTDAVNDIAISGNGRYMISGSNDKTARVWDLGTGKQLRILPVDCWKVTSVAFSSDSRYAVTGCNDGSIKVWEVENGKLVDSYRLESSIVRNVQFGKTSAQILATFMLRGSENYGLRIYQTSIVQGDAPKTPSAPSGNTKNTAAPAIKAAPKTPAGKP
jgi:WD40 repeat protein